MIILPDRNIARDTRVLVPIHRRLWQPPSKRRNVFGGAEDRTYWVVSARDPQAPLYRRTDIGDLGKDAPVWCGWFEDRDDADAFLSALAEATLATQPTLWSLCGPNWSPDLGKGLVYELVTTTYLTSTSGSVQTCAVPSDWNSSNNTIDAIGSGASGGAQGSASYAGSGGGGAWAIVTNLALSANGTYMLPAGGAQVSSPAQSGNAGADCWFSNMGSAPGSTSAGVLAKGGSASTNGTPPTAAAGGAAASCISSATAHSGGAGSNGSNYICGGGGAAGPNANGNAGSAGSASMAGGQGDGSYGGAGGAAGANVGSDGIEWNASPARGSGGGGGSNSGSGGTIGGAGGRAGGGGGGATGNGTATCVGGAGGDALIRIVYTPAVKAGGFNMPMLGM